MNLLAPNLNEPVQFERLTYIAGLDGLCAGPVRVMAVLNESTRLCLGKRSWYDLAQRLGARDIPCEVQGPLFRPWAVRNHWDHNRT